VNDAGRAYLYFEFLPDGGGQRRWINRGWQADEYDEWAGYSRLSETCASKRAIQAKRLNRPNTENQTE
jgi:hypothetical protein